MHRFVRLLFAAAVVAALLALPARAATTWYVDGTVGTDNATCGTAPLAGACRTIQFTVDKASAGDTIMVAPGIYPENDQILHIDKTLTLLGAQAGVDARGRVGAESRIMTSKTTVIEADNVVIDGFTIEGNTNNNLNGAGLWMGCRRAGGQVLNNIVQRNIVGIYLTNRRGGNRAVIRHNQIQNNNNPGSASGSGIYTDEFVACGDVQNVLVQENAFVGNDNAGMDISNTDFTGGGVFNLDVSDNTFTGNGRAFVLFNAHSSTFDGNAISGSTLAGSADIRIFDDNSDLLFTNNDLRGGVGHAARLAPFFGQVNSDIVFHYNNFEVYGLTGLTVEQGSHVGTVNAECNWWNSSTGPFNPNNPGGTGEEVVGDADFSPWLIARAPGGACVGIVSTPGKVTGGGQVQGDPVFSSGGSLLSPPAIVPSAASPTAQATFGFVVTCCPAKGNLEYDDHAGGVRIKAKSIAALNIGDGTCGANTHATFTGTASVIRAAGTTTEEFTVDVDDCGEPGTLDTFHIDAVTYENGPSPLIGGNIQIHRQ